MVSHLEFEDSDNCRALWCAVIERAINDASAPPHVQKDGNPSKAVELARADALAFFANRDGRLRDICDVLNLDAESLAAGARKRIAAIVAERERAAADKAKAQAKRAERILWRQARKTSPGGRIHVG